MNMDDTVKNILRLEEELSIENPHRMSEIAVQISILLGNLVEPLNDLEVDYQELRSSLFHRNLDRKIRPTPAKDRLEFEPELIKKKLQIDKLKEFIRSRERTINRIENHLREKVKMETRGL